MDAQSYNAAMAMNQPLVRSADAKIAGVCGGLAAWLDFDPTAVRVVWLLATLLTVGFPGVLLYLFLWMMMPGPNDGAVSSGTLAMSRRHSVIAGVCGGFADWLGWDPTAVRVVYVILSICSVAFPGMLVYVILWLMMPRAA
jgi:phage shock protein C